MRKNRIQPAPGQEPIWDNPRPPRVEAEFGRVQLIFKGEPGTAGW
jgi:hypothetical protein